MDVCTKDITSTDTGGCETKKSITVGVAASGGYLQDAPSLHCTGGAEELKRSKPVSYRSSKTERRSKKTARYTKPSQMHGALSKVINVSKSGEPKLMKLKTAIQKNLVRFKK